MAIFNGSKFSFDLNGLAMVAKGKSEDFPSINFYYKQGAVIPVAYDNTEASIKDRDEQYLLYVKVWEQACTEAKESK